MHNDSIQWQAEVNVEDIAYVVSIFEGYDHLAVVRTVDRSRGIIEVAFLIELDFLNGRGKLQSLPIHTMIHY